jgi:uncharacterized protein Smg (DUF494 family)
LSLAESRGFLMFLLQGNDKYLKTRHMLISRTWTLHSIYMYGNVPLLNLN